VVFVNFRSEARPSTDLDLILAHTGDLWEEMRGRHLFITGGTGFFGCWLLESFVWANDHLGLDASVVVLTRNPDDFLRKANHLASHSAIAFHRGDVRDFDFPKGTFSHIIHAATEASAQLNTENPMLMFDTIVEGTRHLLEFARHCGATKLLFTSSGAVYGKQPPELHRIPEDYRGAPDPTDSASAYGEGKRAAEQLCALHHKQYGTEVKIARCFAFIGPYLPLDIHYAVGNFIRDGINGGPIQVKGDGTPYRSYLYAADLAAWLWTILFRGVSCRPYNVGSEEAITIADLAKTVAVSFPYTIEVQLAEKPNLGRTPERYVPSTTRAREELGLEQTFSLRQSLVLTIDFLLQTKRSGIGNTITRHTMK
jgi:nucleoside-diphosphate-sugar epimerase